MFYLKKNPRCCFAVVGTEKETNKTTKTNKQNETKQQNTKENKD